MYKQISENKRKTVFLIGTFLVLIIGFGWVLSYAYQNPGILIIAVVFSLTQTLISYYYSDKIALMSTGALEIKSKKDNPYLWRLVENLCITSGLPMPKLYVIGDPAINAFATGRDPKHASIAVTNGALEKLENEELQGVLAHELSHVQNYDIRVMTIVVVLVGVVSIAADFFVRTLLWGGGDRRGREGSGALMLVGILFAVIAPITATLIQLAISRKREYLADASGVMLTRYPQGLAAALEKIARQAHPHMARASRATAHLFISSPLRNEAEAHNRRPGTLSTLFSTHPPLPDRIARLRSMV